MPMPSLMEMRIDTIEEEDEMLQQSQQTSQLMSNQATKQMSFSSLSNVKANNSNMLTKKLILPGIRDSSSAMGSQPALHQMSGMVESIDSFQTIN